MGIDGIFNQNTAPPSDDTRGLDHTFNTPHTCYVDSNWQVAQVIDTVYDTQNHRLLLDSNRVRFAAEELLTPNDGGVWKQIFHATLVNQRYDKDHDRHDLDREMSIARSKTLRLDPQGEREETSAVATSH